MLIVLHGMLSLKNKKQKRAVFALAVLLFSSGIFLLTSSGVHAAEDYGYFGNAFMAVFKSLLYGIFVMVGWFASMAITLFEWAILPENVSGNSGLLNRNSIYSMWKMIRDFFNLFFILTLLYTAFTIVFQVAKNYKQTLLSIILAAMFVNFSFPITRVIIDMTNVPMYYFVNQLGSNGSSQKDYLGTVLSATKLQDILVPGSKGGISNVNFSNIGVSQLLMAIVFLFIFSVTLLVLAVMFVVRLAALIILLIFSSVGFAASVIPGLEKYGSMWWEKLAQYALFGPAAMLMLVIATQFFAEISQDNTNAQFVQAGLANSTPETAGFISSMAMFTVPIVMLWAAIGLAVSSSLVGAGAVVGLGYAAIKGAGKFVAYKNPVTRGFGLGAKERFQGTKVGRWLKSPSSTEAAIKGWTKKTSLNPVPGWRDSGKGRAGARTELQKLKDKQINEQIAKDKENKLSRTDALNRMKSQDEVMRVSAATSLASMDNGIQSMDDLAAVLKAIDKPVTDPTTGVTTQAYQERAVEIISKADKKIIEDTPATATAPAQTGLQNLQSVIGSLGSNQKAISDLISKLDDSAFSGSGADFGAVHAALEAVKPGMGAALEAKAKKEGKTDALLDHQFNTRTNPALTRADFAIEMLKKLEAADIAKQEMFRNPASANRGYATAYMTSIAAGGANENISRWQKIRADLP